MAEADGIIAWVNPGGGWTVTQPAEWRRRYPTERG